VAGSAAAGLFACRPAPSDTLSAASPPRGALVADVVHSWTSGGELAAINVVADEYERRGGSWRHSAVAGFDNAGAMGINRMIGGKPPSAMFFVAGPALNDLADRGMLTPVDQLADAAAWQPHFPATLLASVTRGGKLMAVPLNLHTQSLLYSSRVVLAKAGISRVPTTWPDFFAALDAVKAQGAIPLALGGQTWQESILFNAVLVSVVGKRGYEKVYLERDQATVLGPGFRRAVEIFGRLRGYVDANAAGRNWNDATHLVIADRAAFHLMGDWALSEFTVAGKAPGTDFECAVGFGDDVAIAGSDTMSFPRARGDAARRAQQLLAEVMLDARVQHDFARKLGPLPARLDAPVDDLHPCVRHAARLVRNADTAVPTPYMALAPDVLGDIDDVIAEYWSNPDMSADAMARRFADVLRTAT